MGIKRPTASKSALLLGDCLYWASPEAVWFDESMIEPDAKRDNGTVFHGWMDDYAKGQESGAKCSDDIEQAKYMAMYQHAVEWLSENQLDPAITDYRSERVIGFSLKTQDTLETDSKAHRDYPDKGQDWLWGTADFVAFYAPDGITNTMLVGDWKTGESDGSKEQLLTLLVGFWLRYGHFKSFKTVCLQVNEFGVWPEWHEYTEADLQAHLKLLKDRWDLKNNKHLPVLGVHCTKLYCPALAYCPAVKDGELDMSIDAETSTQAPDPAIADRRIEVTDRPTSDNQAGYSMAVIAAARRRAKYIESGCKKYIEHGGKVTYEGYEWADGGNGFRWRKVK